MEKIEKINIPKAGTNKQKIIHNTTVNYNLC